MLRAEFHWNFIRKTVEEIESYPVVRDLPWQSWDPYSALVVSLQMIWKMLKQHWYWPRSRWIWTKISQFCLKIWKQNSISQKSLHLGLNPVERKTQFETSILLQNEHLLFFLILRMQIPMRNLTEVTMKLLVGWTDHSFTLRSRGVFFRTRVLSAGTWKSEGNWTFLGNFKLLYHYELQVSSARSQVGRNTSALSTDNKRKCKMYCFNSLNYRNQSKLRPLGNTSQQLLFYSFCFTLWSIVCTL